MLPNRHLVLEGAKVKNTLKFCLTWIIGVVLSVVIMSVWRNEEVDWKLLFGLIIGCLIGVLFVFGIMMYMKKTKSKANE